MAKMCYQCGYWYKIGSGQGACYAEPPRANCRGEPEIVPLLDDDRPACRHFEERPVQLGRLNGKTLCEVFAEEEAARPAEPVVWAQVSPYVQRAEMGNYTAVIGYDGVHWHLSVTHAGVNVGLEVMKNLAERLR